MRKTVDACEGDDYLVTWGGEGGSFLSSCLIVIDEDFKENVWESDKKIAAKIWSKTELYVTHVFHPSPHLHDIKWSPINLR